MHQKPLEHQGLKSICKRLINGILEANLIVLRNGKPNDVIRVTTHLLEVIIDKL